MDFDFSHEEDFVLVSEGIHKVRVESIEEKTASTGTAMVVFKLRVQGGGLLWHQCTNEETKRWMLKKTLHAITGKKPPKGPILIDENDLIDQEFEVEVFHDFYKGMKRAKVKDVIVPDLEEETPPEEEARPKKREKVPF